VTWNENDPRSADALAEEGAEQDRRTLKWLMWIFSFTIVAAAAAFGWKIYEFAHDLVATEGLRFAGAHLLTYVLVAGGFFMLLLFCFLRGHFSDIEKPKHDLLEQERRYDLREFA
jgi:hypothetical protein